MTIFPLQLLRLCTKYKPSKVIEKDNIYFVIFRALKTMLKNSQYLNEIMEKLLANKRLMKIFLGNGTYFLKELTQGHLRPKSIWSKKDLESLITCAPFAYKRGPMTAPLIANERPVPTLANNCDTTFAFKISFFKLCALIASGVIVVVNPV